MTLALAAALALAATQGHLFEDARAPWLRARREAFLEAWVAADDARRELALRELERLTSPGAPPLAPTSARALGRAWRVMVREDEAHDAEQDALERLAESLHLRAVPGVFDAGSPGEPVTVHVSSPESDRWGGTLELRLSWLAPAGSRRAPLRARTTEAFPDAFSPEGFELFVRTPEAAEAGTWRLELELVDGERVARAPAHAVECLAPREESDDERGSAVARELESWRLRGVPATPGLPAADLLEEEGGRFERVFYGFGDQWAWRPAGALRGVVVVLSPSRDPALAVLSGVRGARWRTVAREAGLLLLPLNVEEGGATDMLELLLDSVAGSSTELEGAPRVLAARADSAPYIALGRGAEPPFDAWALCWGAERPPRLPWPETPTLVLSAHATEADAALDDEHPARRLRPGTGVPLLDDLRLPALARELAESLAR